MVAFDFDKYNNIKYDKLNLDIIKKQLLDDDNMLGWYDLNTDFLDDVISTADLVRKKADVFLVIGTGGSINCSRAIVEAFKPYFKKNKPEVIYLGDSLSSDYIKEVLDYVKDKSIYVDVISKGSKTMEVNLTFEIVLYMMEKKYNIDELKERIIVTTENKDNYLNQIANNYGFRSFFIRENIGGRFSMFTPASLLPMAVSNINIKMMFVGAKEAKNNLSECYKYVLYRHNMYLNNLVVESFNVYEPRLSYYLEWLKQLFAESQGKDKKGILPIGTINPRDLHSKGQYLQDGLNIVFETNIFNYHKSNFMVSKYNKSIDEINRIVMQATAEAHYNSNRNSIIIEMDKIDELNLGYLSFFFMMSAAIGSYLIRVKYYDELAVNEYKNIMNKLLDSDKSN